MVFRQDPKLHGLDNVHSLLVYLFKLTCHEVSHLSRPDYYQYELRLCLSHS